jgi:hypothetical protein
MNRIIIRYLYPKYCHYLYNGDPIFRPHILNHDGYDYMQYFICQILYNSKTTKEDINNFYIFIESNNFISLEDKTRQFEVYQTMRNIKSALLKFIYMCKLRYATSQNRVNMYMEPFTDSRMQLIENGHKYTFELFELKKITITPFNYSELDIPILLKVRNPYTNKPFSEHNVYNIYFKLMQNYMVPVSFHLYINSSMNMFLLKSCYGIYIFIECIKRKYTQLSYLQRIRLIYKLCRFYGFDSLCKIPIDILHDKFEGSLSSFYIFYHLYVNNYDNDALLYHFTSKYFYKLKDFYEKNYNYGREIYKKDITGKYIKLINDIVIY